MLLCAITDRNLFPGSEKERIHALEIRFHTWVMQGVQYVQLREKDLEGATQISLASRFLECRQSCGTSSALPRLLINSRADIALAVAADGVHLTSGPGELTPQQVRELYLRARLPRPLVSCSCHTSAQVIHARQQAVDLILYGPIFGKTLQGLSVVPATGLAALAQMCRIAFPVPVLALGGVELCDAELCLRAGAAGVAGIRAFADPQFGM